MENKRFQARLAAWQIMPGNLEEEGYLGRSYPGPLDARFDALCALYLGASVAQQEVLLGLFADDSGTTAGRLVTGARCDNLLNYIWRVARRIKTAESGELAQWGLAAAAIAAAAGADERDVLHACAFLKYATIQASINLAALIEEMPSQARPEARRVLEALLKSDQATIARIVRYHEGTG